MHDQLFPLKAESHTDRLDTLQKGTQLCVGGRSHVPRHGVLSAKGTPFSLFMGSQHGMAAVLIVDLYLFTELLTE